MQVGLLVRPQYRELIREAVTNLGGRCTQQSIVDYIKLRYPDTNAGIIRIQITAFSVNAPSRINWPKNKKPRKADDPRYDFLFSSSHEAGGVVLYDPNLHGQWSIVQNDGKLTVAQNGTASEIKSFKSVQRIVMHARSEDVLLKLVRVDHDTFSALAGARGPGRLFVEIKAKRTTVSRCELAEDFIGEGILMDKPTRENIGSDLADTVDVVPVQVSEAEAVTLQFEENMPVEIGFGPSYIGGILKQQAVAFGDRLHIPFKGRMIRLRVAGISPVQEYGLIAENTKLELRYEKRKEAVACLSCQAENPAGSKFCNQCGSKLFA